MERIWDLRGWAVAANAWLVGAILLHGACGPGLQAVLLYLPAALLSGIWGGVGPGLAMALAAVLAESLVASLKPGAEPLRLAYANDLLSLGAALSLAILGAVLRRGYLRQRRAAETAEALLRLTRATGDPTQLAVWMKALVEMGPELSGGDSAVVFTWDEGGRRFTARQQTSGVGISLDEVALPTGQPPLSRLLTERQPVLLTDETSEGRALLTAARLRPLRRALCVPAASWGRMVGCLVIGDRRSARPFTAEEVEIATLLAGQLAVALENAASFQAIQDRATEVARLLQLSNALNSRLDLTAILREVAEGAAAIAHAPAASVGLVDGERVLFQERWHAGQWQAAPRSRSLEEVIAADAGANGSHPGRRTLLIRDLQGEPLGALEIYEAPWSGHASDRAGVGMDSAARGAWQEEARLLSVFANEAALAIQNGRLYESLQRQHRRLQELEKLREDLTHMIVHDLRTPLTGILGSLQTLESGVGGTLPPIAQELNQLALRSARALLGLVNDLLDIGKLESGKMALDRATVAASALVREAADQVEPLLRERKQELRLALPEELPEIRADRDLAVRVLVNLLGNAVKFTPRGGTITVSAAPAGSFVTFGVRDTGEGIPREYQETIFEKFGQVQTSRSGRKYATGLGLTFCKMAVEAHGGQIAVTSEPAAGSTFTFTLPAGPPIAGRNGEMIREFTRIEANETRELEPQVRADGGR